MEAAGDLVAAAAAAVPLPPVEQHEPAAGAPAQSEFIPLPDDEDSDTSDESDSADGAYEFGSPLAQEASSSSWDSDEEPTTHEPIDRDALPVWLARKRQEGSDDEDDDVPAAYVEPVVQAAPCVIPPVAPDENIALAGVVTSVVGPLVIVQANPSAKPLNDGSIMCMVDGAVIGEVEETFGPVQAPLYAVRRCKAADGDEMVQVPPGTEAYYVVSRSTFIDDIQKLHVKGYDASGTDDRELEEVEEFSDDEQEEAARQARRQQKRAGDGDAVQRDTMEQGQSPVAQQRPRGKTGRKAGPAPHGHVSQQAGMQPAPGWLPPPWGFPAGQMPWVNGPPGGQLPPYGMAWPQYGMLPPPYGGPQGQPPPGR